MGTIFLGSEALARGELTRGRLRSAYRPMFPDVYQSRLATPSLYGNTMGAWLWSKRRDNDRFTTDDVVEINGMAVATIQRTALDLGRFLPRRD
ncbi:hypothetical protein [Mycolicibacterium porcinum]|uniref:Uncharacterized protein n=1 Tax=Mycolicibacterium porcinum TaxID=39693 RepID=A0ABV3VDM6_9MYCO|nr:hypothetical protein [Mycolicibacterium porcinum]ORB42476.1 hypothetical protein BST41_07180 [Mycolicibacterium porcinum]CDO32109.1 hypothetical protein BN979_04934 [Mycolicibacterium vulneris]